jgi:uncharacterized membrane protein YdbT with pleckstrin-like domain
MPFVPGPIRADEPIRYRARTHWIVFLPPIVLLLAALYALALNTFVAIGLLLATAISLIGSYMTFSMAQIVVTDRRVSVRRGMLGSLAGEVDAEAISGVDVNRSWLGEKLNFGTVTVRSTAGATEPLPLVAAPEALSTQLVRNRRSGR